MCRCDCELSSADVDQQNIAVYTIKTPNIVQVYSKICLALFPADVQPVCVQVIIIYNI